jgi:hypothetical protein
MKDFLYDDNFDLLIKDGDLAIGDSDVQSAQELLLADKGWYSFDPTVGAGIIHSLNDEITAISNLISIRRGLEADGMSVQLLEFEGERLKIDYNYARRIVRSGLSKNIVFTEEYQWVAMHDTQSIFDLALIFYGTAEAVWRIMELNNKTAFPPLFREGETIKLDKLTNTTGNQFDQVSPELATIPDSDLKGIGYFIIGSDFIQ